MCGSSVTTSRIVPGKRALGGDPLTIARCPACGVSFQPTLPGSDALTNYYDYMGKVDSVAAEPSAFIGRRLTRMLSRLEPYRNSGRLLDVGCGRGTVALAARRAGWDVYATEISASCVVELRPLFGERLHHGSLLDAPFAPESFDAVLMIEVLEHLADPGGYLTASLRLLRPGGCLLLTTPNFRGLSGRLRRDAWRVVADEHLTYFDEATLGRLLRSSGFTLVRIVTTGLDLPALVGWLRGSPGRPQSTGTAVWGDGSDRSHGSAIADAGVEAVNAILAALRLGDALRALAERPSSR